jgi:hypothetical protein
MSHKHDQHNNNYRKPVSRWDELCTHSRDPDLLFQILPSFLASEIIQLTKGRRRIDRDQSPGRQGQPDIVLGPVLLGRRADLVEQALEGWSWRSGDGRSECVRGRDEGLEGLREADRAGSCFGGHCCSSNSSFGVGMRVSNELEVLARSTSYEV